MQSCNNTSCGQTTTVREFISRKTQSFPSAWLKGRNLESSDVVHTSSSAKPGASSASRSRRHSRKRKQMTAEVDHHGKRITTSTTARKIAEQLESLKNCIDDLEKTPRSLLESSERGDLAEKMLNVFTKLTKFPVRDGDEISDSSTE